MAFVGAIVFKSATLARQAANELCVGNAGVLELPPEEGTPTPLGLLLGTCA
jgi:phospholipid N-methyltransferase